MHGSSTDTVTQPTTVTAAPASFRNQEVFAIQCHRTAGLAGAVKVSGSKNVGLKLLTTVPLFHNPVTLRGVPRNNQVRFLLGLLQEFGIDVSVKIENSDGFNLSLHASDLTRNEFEYQEIRWCRHMFLLAMSVLVRTGSVRVPVPGYSHYGPRPITGQLRGLTQMGAIVSSVASGMVRIELPKGGLRGTEVFLPFPSNAVLGPSSAVATILLAGS